MSQNTLQSANLALVAIGGNLPSLAGPPEATIRAAIQQLICLQGVAFTSLSRLWQTPAFPLGSGPDYVNAALSLQTVISPTALLSALHEIETGLGRVREGARWQSRGIDLDLLAYGDLVLPDRSGHDAWRDLPEEERAKAAPETLILPHPRLQERGFVLMPLAEVAPNWRHPRLGTTVAEMLAALPPAARADIRPVKA